jgi:small subunit ribosomal protein S17
MINKMAETKKPKKAKEQKTEIINDKCMDDKCPFHGTLSVRGRVFRGTVIKKFPKRAVIEFERTLYIPKYERFAKSKTKLHAKLPDCLDKEINIGDYIEIRECRKLSKIISFVVMKKIRSSGEKSEVNLEEKK